MWLGNIVGRSPIDRPFENQSQVDQRFLSKFEYIFFKYMGTSSRGVTTTLARA